MVNTGLMRKMSLITLIKFEKKYKINVKLVNAESKFLYSLKNISNPEKKKNYW